MSIHKEKDKHQVHYHGEGLKNLILGIGIGAVATWLFTTPEGDKLRQKLFEEEGEIEDKLKEFLASLKNKPVQPQEVERKINNVESTEGPLVEKIEEPLPPRQPQYATAPATQREVERLWSEPQQVKSEGLEWDSVPPASAEPPMRIEREPALEQESRAEESPDSDRNVVIIETSSSYRPPAARRYFRRLR